MGLRFGEEVEDDDVAVWDAAEEGFDGVVGPEGGEGVEEPALEHPDGVGVGLCGGVNVVRTPD